MSEATKRPKKISEDVRGRRRENNRRDWRGGFLRESAWQATKVTWSHTRPAGHAVSIAEVPFALLQVNDS